MCARARRLVGCVRSRVLRGCLVQCAYPRRKERQVGGVVYPYEHRCGQCMPCRITRAQEKAARVDLEASLWPEDMRLFVTLTYAPESVPVTPGGRLTLRQSDARAFLHAVRDRLRAADARVEVRHSVTGEYGGRTNRPHYHVVLFGLPRSFFPYSEKRPEFLALQKRLFPDWVPPADRGIREFLMACWRYRGHIDIGSYGNGVASYVSHYVSKMMTSRRRMAPEDDREPEFMTWSKGFGFGVIPGLVSALERAKVYPEEHPALSGGADWQAREGVFRVLRRNGRLLRLDQYFRGKCWAAMGGDQRTEEQKYFRLSETFQSRWSLEDEGLSVVDLAPEETRAAHQRTAKWKRRSKGRRNVF